MGDGDALHGRPVADGGAVPEAEPVFAHFRGAGDQQRAFVSAWLCVAAATPLFAIRVKNSPSFCSLVYPAGIPATCAIYDRTQPPYDFSVA